MRVNVGDRVVVLVDGARKVGSVVSFSNNRLVCTVRQMSSQHQYVITFTDKVYPLEVG